MSEEIKFDSEAAHRTFSAQCFNQAWDLIDKAQRTAEEDEQMIRLAMASHYHWTQRADYTATNKSVAYWQISRVYAVLGQGENARHYGEQCLKASQEPGVGPFYLGYAYEALARVDALMGETRQMEEHLNEARKAAMSVMDEEAREALLDDLGTIRAA